MVTGKNAGSVNVDDRTDDWLKLYVKNLDTDHVMRDWTHYGLGKGGLTELPANSVFHVKFKWSSNDGAAKFKINLNRATVFNSALGAGHGAQIFRQC